MRRLSSHFLGSRGLQIGMCVALALAIAAPHAFAQPAGETLTFSEALRAAVAASPSTEAAKARLQKSEALIQQAWSLLLPTLQSALNYTHWDIEVAFEAPTPDGTGLERLVIQRQDMLDARNTISMSLFNYSALPLLNNAYEGVDIERTSVRATERAVRYQAAAAFVQIMAAQRNLAVAEEDVTFFTEHLGAEEKRLDRGVGDRLGVLRSRQELSQARHRLADANRAVQFAKESLALLMDRPSPGFEVTPALPLPAVQESWQHSEPAAALEGLQREDIAIAEALTTVADRDVDVIWGDFLPRLDASFNHTWTNAPGFAGRENRWNIMLTATWTWFDGGLRYGQLSEKRAALAQAYADLEQTRQKARFEVLAAQQELRDASARLQQSAEAVALAQETQTAAKRLFEGGLADYLRLFDARFGVRQSELAELAAQTRVEMAQLKLLQSLGLDLLPE